MAAIKASHEQLPSVEKQILWKLQIRTSHPKINSRNSTCARASFSIKLQAIGQEHLFYGISPDDCFFLKILKETPLKKSCFNNDEDSRLETLLKQNLTVLKQVTYVACMRKIISVTGTPHRHKFQ